MKLSIRSFYLSIPLALIIGVAPLMAAPVPKDKPKESGPEFIRKMLDNKVNMEFNGIGLPNVLSQLSEDNRIHIVLDEASVRIMGFEPTDIMINCKLKDVKLRTGLRTMLNQYNLTVAIVGEQVLVTTEEQAIYKQLKQRVEVDLDNVPLNRALKDLAIRSGVNIIIDPRTSKNKANEAPVSLTVDDIPLEAAVRLICEIGGLKPARMGNVLFVTTEDRADKLKDADYLLPSNNPLDSTLYPGGIGPGIRGGGTAPIPMVVPPPAAPAVPVPVVEDKTNKRAAPDKPEKN